MEYLDVYDLSGEKTGRTVLRSSDFSDFDKDDRLLLVHVCVFNSNHELLMQRRQLTKDRYPGIWDVSAGGFVVSGETSRQAVKRELREEIGIEISDDEIELVHREPFGIVFDDFYMVHRDQDISQLEYQKDEVMDLAWGSRATVLSRLRDGTFVDYPEELLKRMFEAD